MPPIMQYQTPDGLARTNLSQLYAGEMKVRGDWFDQIRRFYNGDQPPSLDVKEDEINDNAVINMVKQATDRTVGFLFSAFPKLELDPNTSEETPDEKWLKDMWEANGGIALLHEMSYIGSFSGHVYARVMPPDPYYGDEFPQIILLDPKSVQTWWKADDMRRVIFHEVRWSVRDKDDNQIDYVLDFVNRGKKGWTIYEYQSAGSSGTYKLTNTEEWRLPLPPIIHWKHLPNTRSFYGMGEYDKSQLQLNLQINNVASENNRIVRYHSSPKTVGTGITSGDIKETSVDQLWAVEKADAKIYNLEMSSDLTAAMGHLQTLVKAFLAESRVVILEGSVKDFQRVTNAGVRTVFIDMLSKLVVLRWNYGKAIQAISRTAAAVAKKGNDVIPEVVYDDPLPVDDTERVNVAQLERSMGIVSHETISTKRGYNWVDELRKMTKEKELDVFAPPEPVAKPGQPNPQQKGKPGDETNKQPGLKNEPGSTSNK